MNSLNSHNYHNTLKYYQNSILLQLGIVTSVFINFDGIEATFVLSASYVGTMKNGLWMPLEVIDTISLY